MKKIDVWEKDVYRIRVPLSFPLRWVNSYAVRGPDGWTVIDPGIRSPEAESAWNLFFRETGTTPSDIHAILLTHHHPDHYGLSGWLQEHSGAPVYMSVPAWRQAGQLWGPDRTMTDELLGLFAGHGMDTNMLDRMHNHLESFVPLVSPAPRVHFLSPQETVTVGRRRCLALSTPGHAQGHLSFYCEEDGVMFCGDHVIPGITPNVSYLPGVDDNPLQSYVESLRIMAEIPVRTAFPGHRHPFGTYRERIREILEHHEKRLSRIESGLHTAKNAYEMCRELFGSSLSVHQLRFALSETLAHLIFLREENRIVPFSQGGVIYWEK